MIIDDVFLYRIVLQNFGFPRHCSLLHIMQLLYNKALLSHNI